MCVCVCVRLSFTFHIIVHDAMYGPFPLIALHTMYSNTLFWICSLILFIELLLLLPNIMSSSRPHKRRLGRLIFICSLHRPNTHAFKEIKKKRKKTIIRNENKINLHIDRPTIQPNDNHETIYMVHGVYIVCKNKMCVTVLHCSWLIVSVCETKTFSSVKFN